MDNDAPAIGEHPSAGAEAAARAQALVEEAQRLATVADRIGLRKVAVRISKALAGGRTLTGDHFQLTFEQRRALDVAFDGAFPVTDSADLADVLDTPWFSESRRTHLSALVGHQWSHTDPARDTLMDAAVAAGDTRVLRLLVVSTVGVLRRQSVVRAFDALDALGALDAATVEHALTNDLHLGYALLGISPRDNTVVAPPAASLPTVQPIFDELTWRLLSDGAGWNQLPKVLKPTGLRFVLLALGGEHDQSVTAHLGAATLTDGERADLVEHLRVGTDALRQRAFALRRPAGDAAALLPLLGLASAAPLLELIERTTSYLPDVHDRSTILAAVEAAGVDSARQLLTLVPSEIVAAAMGWNRAAVEKRVKSNALAGIAAFGMLPLADGESVLDRYLVLRDVAKRGPKLGPNRRHSHAAAIDVALRHFAQVAGFEDAQRLEWHCEAQIGDSGPGTWAVDAYSLSVSLDGDDPAIVVVKAGKALKSVPAALRATPQYAEARSRQEMLREQARRLRTGLIERLVATAATLTPEEFTHLMALPAGAAMLPALLWRDSAGRIGLIDQIDSNGPLTAVHPLMLYERDLLSEWQANVVHRRLRQPVKQVFRELYLLTPAERAAGGTSTRFAGHTVVGKVAAQLLSVRGWTVHGEYNDVQATRPAGQLTAALHADLDGYFGMSDVVLGDVRFLAGGTVTPLADVPPIVLSEVMRDLDLVVSVAGTAPTQYHSAAMSKNRASLLGALIDDLNLDRIRVDGHQAVVTGSRATYRVHLTSGSIHIDPGGYLCVVPADFGKQMHKRLFLPFADEDRMTTVILSKVLLLANDEKITDESILSQIQRR